MATSLRFKDSVFVYILSSVLICKNLIEMCFTMIHRVCGIMMIYRMLVESIAYHIIMAIAIC